MLKSDKPLLIKLSRFGQADYVVDFNGYLKVDMYFISLIKFCRLKPEGPWFLTQKINLCRKKWNEGK